MLKIEKKFTVEDILGEDSIDIELTFIVDDMFTFVLNSCELEKIKPDQWYNLINDDGYSFDISEKYGSHCDHATVSLSNKDGYIVFCTDTATGGKSTFRINIDKCKDQFYELAEWYKTLPLN